MHEQFSQLLGPREERRMRRVDGQRLDAESLSDDICQPSGHRAGLFTTDVAAWEGSLRKIRRGHWRTLGFAEAFRAKPFESPTRGLLVTVVPEVLPRPLQVRE